MKTNALTFVLASLALGSVSPSARAEPSPVLVQPDIRSNNAFIAGEAGQTLYNLLKTGVGTEALPNGGAVTGQFLACTVTFGADLKDHFFCAINIDKDGLTRANTPMFDRSAASISGQAEVTDFSEIGLTLVTLSGDAAQTLFDGLAAKETKNLTCQMNSPSAYRCSFFMNERGYAEPSFVMAGGQ